MANVTFRAVLNDTPSSQGLHAVMIRITYQRQKKYVGTSVYVLRKHFNENGTFNPATGRGDWIRKGCSEYESFNALIGLWFKRGHAVIKRLQELGRTFSVSDIKRLMENSEDSSFSAYIQSQIDLFQSRHQRSNVRNHTTLLKCIRQFLGRQEFQLQDFTPDTVKAFETFLLTRKRRNDRPSTDAAKRNSATDYLRRFRQHVNGYIKANQLPSELDPTRNMKLTTAPVNRLRLTQAEMAIWLGGDWPIKTKFDRTLHDVRKLYAVSYFLHGIRGGDLIAARVEQIQEGWQMVNGKPVRDYRFVYISEKKDKPKTIRIEEEILPILLEYCKDKEPKDFIFPFLRTEHRDLSPEALKVRIEGRLSYIDELLKEVAKRLEIPKAISMHTARHTFAEHLYDSTEDIRLVSMALSHSNILTTQRYLSGFRQDIVDRANNVYKGFRKKEADEEEEPKAEASRKVGGQQKAG